MGISMVAQELNYVPELSVEENLFLGRLPVNRFGKVDWRKIRRDARQFLKDENLPYEPTQKLKTLTVSDIQMLEIIKAVTNNAQVIIMDEPTRGIDVGAKFEIYKLITDIVKEGKAVIMVSSELPELIGMCDRIYIMCQGKISGCINREEFSQEVIMRYATGLKNG